MATYDTTRFGTSFVMPIGENTPTPAGVSPAFEYTGASIMASESGTVVHVDANGDGIVDLSQTINEGEAVHVNGGLLQGARITTSKPVQVSVLTGDKNAEWEARFFELLPTALHASDYLNPVGSPPVNQEKRSAKPRAGVSGKGDAAGMSSAVGAAAAERPGQLALESPLTGRCSRCT